MANATNGTFNGIVARLGRPGNAGLVKKAVLAARSSEPTIRMCRSNGMKDVGAGHKNILFFLLEWSFGVRPREIRIAARRDVHFTPGELCCENILQCEDAADSGSLMILSPCVVTHAVGICFSRLQNLRLSKA